MLWIAAVVTETPYALRRPEGTGDRGDHVPHRLRARDHPHHVVLQAGGLVPDLHLRGQAARVADQPVLQLLRVARGRELPEGAGRRDVDPGRTGARACRSRPRRSRSGSPRPPPSRRTRSRLSDFGASRAMVVVGSGMAMGSRPPGRDAHRPPRVRSRTADRKRLRLHGAERAHPGQVTDRDPRQVPEQRHLSRPGGGVGHPHVAVRDGLHTGRGRGTGCWLPARRPPRTGSRPRPAASTSPRRRPCRRRCRTGPGRPPGTRSPAPARCHWRRPTCRSTPPPRPA